MRKSILSDRILTFFAFVSIDGIFSNCVCNTEFKRRNQLYKVLARVIPMTTLQQLKDTINANFTKSYAVGCAIQMFDGLSTTRKEKIIRSLYMNDLTVRRMYEHEGCLMWEIISSKHHRALEHAKYQGITPDLSDAESYTVIVDRKLKWHCNCYWFGKRQNYDECTHIMQIKLTNILREYVNYFIYVYRFMLPHVSYKKFFLDFVIHQ